MTNIALYIDIGGCILFAVILAYQLLVSNKMKKNDFLYKHDDPKIVERYKLIATTKYKVLTLVFMLLCLIGIPIHKSSHSSKGTIVIYVLGILFVIIFLQTTLRFKKK